MVLLEQGGVEVRNFLTEFKENVLELIWDIADGMDVFSDIRVNHKANVLEVLVFSEKQIGCLKSPSQGRHEYCLNSLQLVSLMLGIFALELSLL